MPEAIRRAVGRAIERRAVRATTYDAETHTVELVAATDAPVRVPGYNIGIDGFYYEILDMSPGAVDLTQVDAGNCPLLADHNRWDLEDRLGAINAARIEGGQLIVGAEFGRSESAQNIEAEMQSTTPPPCSAGYCINEVRFEGFAEDELPIYRVTRWGLREVSFVSIAADPTAGVRADQNGSHPCIIIEETRAMPQENNAAGAPAAGETETNTEAGRATVAGGAGNDAIGEGGRSAAGDRNVVATRTLTAAELIAAQASARAVGVEISAEDATRASADPVAAINARVLELAAARQSANGVAAGSAARAGEIDAGQRTAMVEVITARIAGRAPSADVGELRGCRVLDLLAIRHGIRSRDPHEILQRNALLGAGDFPMLLEAAANKVLLDTYKAQSPSYQRIAAKRRFNDFKAHKFLRLSEFPSLLSLNENGEIKRGALQESRETVTATTKGIIVAMTRQMLINDDLGAFGDLVSAAARAAARGENRLLFTLLAQNSGAGPTMADTNAMFHTSHANLAGAGTVIDVTNVGKARAAMRKQKNVAGDEILNITPKILLVGPDKETEAEQFVAPVAATQNSQYNPFSGRLDVVGDAEVGTGNQWYLFADPGEAPAFVYGWVGDQEGPMFMQDRPFGVDGMALTVLDDFGLGAVDYRPAYKNPGA